MTATDLDPSAPGDSAVMPRAGIAGRRRSAPSGRAVAGAFFVTVAVILVFVAWQAGGGPQGRPWVVVTRDLPAGARLAASDLGAQRIALPAGGVAPNAFRTAAGLPGEVLAAPMRAGELLQRGDIAPPGATSALRPVTLSVSAANLVDLSVGALVDVLVTDGSDPASPTSVVVAGVRVLDLSQGSSSLIGSDSGARVTLGLASLDQVTSVVHASQTGSVTVVVGMPGDQTSVAPAVGGDTSTSTTPGG